MLNKIKFMLAVKIIISFIFLVLMTTTQSFAQTADKDIQAKWGVLKTALKARAVLVIDMTNDILKQRKEIKKLVVSTNLIAKAIKLNTDSSKKMDSKMVKAFYAKNDSLENQIFLILVSPEIQKDAAMVKKIDGFVLKMDIADKAIKPAKRNYNAACKAAKREDLLYEETKETKGVQKVFSFL